MLTAEIESKMKSPVSIMPKGLLDKLTREEILDLVAYMTARGNRQHPLFRAEDGMGTDIRAVHDRIAYSFNEITRYTQWNHADFRNRRRDIWRTFSFDTSGAANGVSRRIAAPGIRSVVRWVERSTHLTRIEGHQIGKLFFKRY